MPARGLPPRPSLEQYKKQAKELVKAFRSGDSAALQRLRAHHPHLARDTFELADAQLVIAREHGIDSWPKFKQEIERAGERVPPAAWNKAEDANRWNQKPLRWHIAGRGVMGRPQFSRTGRLRRSD